MSRDPETLPTGPVIVVHSIHPDTGLTRCGHRWPGDTHQAQYVPRVKCQGCLMEVFRRG